ncbi:hypothetical protein KPH14_012877 [Odynerus spinipes]|uniref:Uncharacterized protein n=1 Tax=Odynerus spinipes TaxID=1348599 RepID=A0AAD9VKA9_9HYME|nr:hypothetical protein KPH14_012877 [Odynerus spinipes]
MMSGRSCPPLEIEFFHWWKVCRRGPGSRWLREPCWSVPPEAMISEIRDGHSARRAVGRVVRRRYMTPYTFRQERLNFGDAIRDESFPRRWMLFDPGKDNRRIGPCVNDCGF